MHVTLTNRPSSAKNRIIVGSGFSHTNTSTSRNNVQRMADRLSDGSHRVIVDDVFAFEGHTLADIAARLAATSVLVTPAGAGVFNSIFLKRGSAVVVVFQVGAHQCFTHQVSTYVVRTRVRSDRGIHHCKQYAVCLFLRRRTALQYTFMNNYNYLSSKISSNHQQQQQYPQFLRWVADLGVYAIPCAPKSPARIANRRYVGCRGANDNGATRAWGGNTYHHPKKPPYIYIRLGPGELEECELNSNFTWL